MYRTLTAQNSFFTNVHCVEEIRKSLRTRNKWIDYRYRLVQVRQNLKKDFSGWRPTIAFLYLFLFHSLLRLISFLSQYKISKATHGSPLVYFVTSCEPCVAFETLLPVFTQRNWALLPWRDALFCNTKFTKLSKTPVTCWKRFQHVQGTFESAIWLWIYFSSHRRFWSMYGNYIRHPWVSKDMNFFAIRHDTRWAFQANFRQRMGLWWRERDIYIYKENKQVLGRNSCVKQVSV